MRLILVNEASALWTSTLWTGPPLPAAAPSICWHSGGSLCGSGLRENGLGSILPLWVLAKQRSFSVARDQYFNNISSKSVNKCYFSNKQVLLSHNPWVLNISSWLKHNIYCSKCHWIYLGDSKYKKRSSKTSDPFNQQQKWVLLLMAKMWIWRAACAAKSTAVQHPAVKWFSPVASRLQVKGTVFIHMYAVQISIHQLIHSLLQTHIFKHRINQLTHIYYTNLLLAALPPHLCSSQTLAREWPRAAVTGCRRGRRGWNQQPAEKKTQRKTRRGREANETGNKMTGGTTNQKMEIKK